jgi:AAA+ superfamily predicted ATPase
MEDAQIITFETTQTLVADLHHEFPRVAKMLNEPMENLAVIDWVFFPNEYMTGDYRDRVIKTAGPLEGLPLIQKRRQQRNANIGTGVVIYENRLDPEIRYALVTMKGDYDDETFLIIRKDKLFRFRRNAIRLNKEANKILEVPILPDGVLETVMQNTVDFLLKSKEIEKYGVKIKRGLVLDGPPGNGKTMLCRYIQKLCSQNGLNWGVITSADMDEAHNDKNLTELFQKYTVSFFDDIDVAYMDRSKGNSKMACALLTAMDGMSDKGHLVRIFTTNEEVSELDPAFIRPGRIDKCITLEKPDADLRRKLVDNLWPEEIRNNIDVGLLVKESNEFSFAEMESIRTLLVTNKTLGDGKWDLEKAFEEFDSRNTNKNRKGKFGFVSNN